MSFFDSSEDGLSLLDHLEELRWRLLRSVVAVCLGMCVGWFLAPTAQNLLIDPMVRAQKASAEAHPPKQVLKLIVAEDGALRVLNAEMLETETPEAVAFYRAAEDAKPFKIWQSGQSAPIIFLRPLDPFMIRLKIALVLGLVLAIPYIIYQIWAFISPGLLQNERRMAGPLILAGSLLFPLGAAFAYFLLDVTLQFALRYVVDHSAVQNDARWYLNFTLTMMLAFGAVFELPLAVVLATRVGIVTVDWLAARRGPIFIFLLVLAAIITPSGDPIGLLGMTAPLYILFELALIVSRAMDRLAARSADEAESQTDDTPEDTPD